MSRSRYWKLTPDEVEKFTYDSAKLLNWDVKCVREPEEEAIFIGVFMFRHGTPWDYKQIKGIVFFHNNFPKQELPEVTKFLKEKYGGKDREKGERIFLEGSEEIYEPKDIAVLAKDMETRFNTKATITLEFADMTAEEQESAGLPAAKLLPIPGN